MFSLPHIAPYFPGFKLFRHHFGVQQKQLFPREGRRLRSATKCAAEVSGEPWRPWGPWGPWGPRANMAAGDAPTR